MLNLSKGDKNNQLIHEFNKFYQFYQVNPCWPADGFFFTFQQITIVILLTVVQQIVHYGILNEKCVIIMQPIMCNNVLFALLISGFDR